MISVELQKKGMRVHKKWNANRCIHNADNVDNHH